MFYLVKWEATFVSYIPFTVTHKGIRKIINEGMFERATFSWFIDKIELMNLCF